MVVKVFFLVSDIWVELWKGEGGSYVGVWEEMVLGWGDRKLIWGCGVLRRIYR